MHALRSPVFGKQWISSSAAGGTAPGVQMLLWDSQTLSGSCHSAFQSEIPSVIHALHYLSTFKALCKHLCPGVEMDEGSRVEKQRFLCPAIRAGEK